MGSPSRNRLASEPSLYLRQHASNPVDWYPWGEAALDRARREDLPILLSIGYSACHWCHVMEHESFENEAIADLMNRLFVCIKVDREERPDLDGLYMRALQAMTGRGGWPMTIFLTPSLVPYYAGTYFPPEDRGGLPGFPRVLRSVADAYREQRDRVQETSERVAEFLRKSPLPGERRVDREGLLSAGDALLAHVDKEHGGFGTAPKFPNASPLSFLLGLERDQPLESRASALRMTLDRMARGGVYDQLGGGFHRYSVDRYWTVPHFEKMLYDQSLLVDLYREAWLQFGEDAYRRVVIETLEYVVREMTGPDGGFFATQDADSEGSEGKYFLWTKREADAVLDAEDAKAVLAYFDVSEGGNFEETNVLQQRLTVEEVARTLGRSVNDTRDAIERGRRALFLRRSERAAPAVDRKILADWNGLMIGSMAAAGRLFHRLDFLEAACEAARFVRVTLWRGDRLFHFHAEGETRVEAFLDDYAFYGRACLELYAATGIAEHLSVAERCAGILLERFEDRDAGGFFFTAADGNTPIAREKDLSDGSVPSGNAVATELFARLYAMTGEHAYARAAEASLDAWGRVALDNPYAGSHMLAVSHRALLGYGVVVVAEADGKGGLVDTALGVHAPEVAVVSGDAAAAQAVAPVAIGKAATDGRDTAFVCRGATCSAPIHDPSDLLRMVRGDVAR